MAFMKKLLVVVNIKNLYMPLRPTREVIIKKSRFKKSRFYLEYFVGFVQVLTKQSFEQKYLAGSLQMLEQNYIKPNK